MDAASIGEMLRHEHPQIVAAVLVHLDTEQASAVLKTFGERQRNEVLVRIATLDGIQPSALKDLSEVMGRMVTGGEQARMAPLGGVKTAAEMINLMGTAIETAALDYIREADNDLAQRVMDNLFTFDDLMSVDDRGIQALLKEVQSESLVDRLEGRQARAARAGAEEHVDARRRDAARRARGARPGPRRRGRGRAEGAAQGRSPPGRGRPARDRRRQRR